MIRAAAFLSSFLLFLVQPLVAQMVLPSLGGSAQVWSVCVLFFQAALLGGYLYAHGSTRLLGLGGQWVLHALLLVLGLGVFPLGLLPPGGPPPASAPVTWLLGQLLVTVGPPFLVLAASSSLLQRWLSLSEHPGAEDPAYLFAASNAGGLLALVTYPLLLDPFLDLRGRVLAFRIATGAFALLLGGAVFRMRSVRRPEGMEVVPEAPGPRSSQDPGHPGPRRWLVLAAVPSAWMLAVTAHMSQEVPSVPLLWVTPLFLYLLSFTLVFSRERWLPRGLWRGLQPFLLALLSIVLFVPTRALGFGLHLGAFFVTCMVEHGELADTRPSPEGLTGYYLWLALGGALGGLFQGLVAPWLFPVMAEYPLLVVAGAWLREMPGGEGRGAPDPGPGGSPGVSPEAPGASPAWGRRLDVLVPGALALLLAACLLGLPRLGDERDVVVRVALLFFGAAVAWGARRRPRRLALCLAVNLAGGFLAFRLPGTLALRRSPYGVHRVARVEGTSLHQLFHGSTLHGVQDRAHPRTPPVAYFYPASPVAGVLRRVPGSARLAVIGLGVGSVAWYLEPGQRLDYFELDPVVQELARDPRFFSHLAEARGEVRVELGDGRLGLGRVPAGSYDLVFADAFSSDAVPVHLLTREALEVYLEALAPGGALLFNTSNRHLRIEALLGVLARDLGLEGRACLPPPLTPEQERRGLARASFVLMVREAGDLPRWTGGESGWRPVPVSGGPVWRDAHASLLPYLRW